MEAPMGQAVLWVVVGSAAGGLARYWLVALVARWAGADFPWGTLIVNVTGSLAIGVLATWVAAGVVEVARTELLLMVGVLGSYTTVSSFSLETLALARRGAYGAAAANVGLSVASCLLAVLLGHLLARLALGAMS